MSFHRPQSPGQVSTELQGYLFKQGVGGVINTWKRRFFVLKEKKLLYYDGPRMKGFIDLETATSIHAVRAEGRATPTRMDQQDYDLQVVTPIRTYNLRASSVEEMRMWVNNLKAARRGEFGKAQEKLESGDEAETLVTLKSHIVRLEEERETLYEHLNDLQSKLQRAKKRNAVRDSTWMLSRLPLPRREEDQTMADALSEFCDSSEEGEKMSDDVLANTGSDSPVDLDNIETSPFGSSGTPESPDSPKEAVTSNAHVRRAQSLTNSGSRSKLSPSESRKARKAISGSSSAFIDPPVLQASMWAAEVRTALELLNRARARHLELVGEKERQEPFPALRMDRTSPITRHHSSPPIPTFTPTVYRPTPTRAVPMPVPENPPPPPPVLSPTQLSSLERLKRHIGHGPLSGTPVDGGRVRRIEQLEMEVRAKDARIAILEGDRKEEYGKDWRLMSTVVAPFSGRTANELSVDEGDLVVVSQQSVKYAPEWVLAARGDEVGLIPAKHVAPMFPTALEPLMADYASRDDDIPHNPCADPTSGASEKALGDRGDEPSMQLLSRSPSRGAEDEESVAVLVAALGEKDMELQRAQRRSRMLKKNYTRVAKDLHRIESKYLSLLSLQKMAGNDTDVAKLLGGVQLWSFANQALADGTADSAIPMPAEGSSLPMPVCILCALPFCLARPCRQCSRCKYLLCISCMMCYYGNDDESYCGHNVEIEKRMHSDARHGDFDL